MTGFEDKLIEPTIPCEFVGDVLQACGYRGADTDALLAEVGLDAARLRVSGSRISVVDYARLFERVIGVTQDGFLGFLDDPVPSKSFGVFACQMAACRNLKQVLRQANLFYRLFTQQFHFDVEEENEQARIVLQFIETQPFDYRFIYQSILLVLVRLMHWFIGEPIRPTAVSFTFDGVHLDPYLRYLFDCPVYYKQPQNTLCIERHLLTVPCSTTLDQVNLMLRDSARMMLVSHRPAPYTRQVRKALVLRAGGNWPSAEDVAATMRMSKNLLWRKLKKEGTTFLEIRDAVKRDFAMALMDDGHLPVCAIAERVGFADLSAFNKAFHKWVGQSPSAYRTALLGVRPEAE